MAIEVRFRIFKEPVSATTHFAGFLLAIVGLILLVAYSAHDAAKVTGMAIYGGAMAAVFLASSLYHFFDFGPRGNIWLKRFDHAAIFLMIAGSYIPPLIHLLDGAWRTTMLWIVGSLAVAGVIFKMFWINCPTWLSVGLYLLLGWIVVIPAPLIFPKLDASMTAWLVGGGAAYSIGAIVYAFRWPDPWPRLFGFHEIWHIFVLAGAALHYIFMFGLVDVPAPPF